MIKNAITSQEMKSIEINAEYYGISLLQLMEAAGRNVAEEIFSRFDPKDTKIAIFCGLGGNGGDGGGAREQGSHWFGGAGSIIDFVALLSSDLAGAGQGITASQATRYQADGIRACWSIGVI